MNPPESSASSLMPDLVLHGTWSTDAFCLWAETASPARHPRGHKRRVPYHPHAAWPERLSEVLEELAPLGEWSTAQPTVRTVLLPSDAQGPAIAPWLRLEPAAFKETTADENDATDEGETQLLPWRVPCQSRR